MKHIDDRKKHFAALVLVALAVLLITACTTLQQKGYHGVMMKGSIVEVSDSGVYLCIGKSDGAVVGQVLEVYKISASPHPKGGPQFTRENTGSVRITEIFDDHFAKAVVVSGKATVNSIVVLKTP
jgi:hypothetical protein